MCEHPPRTQRQLSFLFASEPPEVSASQMESPEGYTGFYRFHKYWGKKPHEPLAYLIERFTSPEDVVLDPFCGSGTAARESRLRSRRFIGFDINPVAVELTRLLISPPPAHMLQGAIRYLEEQAKPKVLDTYLLTDGKTVATHYLWNGRELVAVWVAGRGGAHARRELTPTAHDRELSGSFGGYQSGRMRRPRFFANGRINAAPEMTLDDLLTGRAQRNIDVMIETIDTCFETVRPALRLCLTAASGQMTRMVFAVTNRGKTTGVNSDKIEVGSWVIGYWRPTLHFEVNAWNCFAKRTRALLAATAENNGALQTRLALRAQDVVDGKADACLSCGDCRLLLGAVPDASVQLVITDPPHSDRIPYLELSEFWNSILGVDADFAREIVISNAKERNKTSALYRESMKELMHHVSRVLRPTGVLILLFNSRDEGEWEFFRTWCTGRNEAGSLPLRYLGFFPCNYSARSVVQDNRGGALKNDLALVFARATAGGAQDDRQRTLEGIPGWSFQFPRPLRGAEE